MSRDLRDVLEELCPGVMRRNWPNWAKGKPLCMQQHPKMNGVFCHLEMDHMGDHIWAEGAPPTEAA